MPSISYAQNCEDVILWRALRDVEGGFYVDVGAADPDEYSVTRAFYERGWSGMNVEPLEEYFNKLAKARPRDTNLRVAAGREPGLSILHAFLGTGLSTFDSEVATRHQATGLKACDTLVPVLTLIKIVEDCGPTAIHFLKIDVEGAEAEVLEGFDLNRLRPWIILIEATEPNSPVNAHEAQEHTRTVQKWEHLITSCGYEFGYFDGLNCFYVAGERAGLKERLGVPPNVFDDFIRWQEWSNGEKIASLEQDLVGVRAHARWLESVSANLRMAVEIEKNYSANLKNALQVEQAQVANLTSVLEAERVQLDRLLTSVQGLEAQLAVPSIDCAAGRMLGRLRELGDRLTGGGMRAFAKRVVTNSLGRTTLFLTRHPRLAALTGSALKPFPILTAKLTPPSAQPHAGIIQSEAGATNIALLPGQASRRFQFPGNGWAISSLMGGCAPC